MTRKAYIPMGYDARDVSLPAGYNLAPLQAIFAVSDCIAKGIADRAPVWERNGFHFFDSMTRLEDAARAEGSSLDGMTVLYFEGVPEQVDDTVPGNWSLLSPDPRFETHVEPPSSHELLGFDVVTSWSDAWALECSPLSCNGIAADVEVNVHGLFASEDDARGALVRGVFLNAEPGLRKIVAVHRVPRGGVLAA